MSQAMQSNVGMAKETIFFLVGSVRFGWLVNGEATERVMRGDAK